VAGASSDGEVNHWPAFVDVLTTVIMVVTFLLVIMSAAVMQLSQRVIQNFKAQMEAREQAHEQTAPERAAVRGAPSIAGNPIQSPAEAEAGTSIAERGSILQSETIVNGADRLTIRTRETKDTLALQVKAVEQPRDARGAQVTTADTLIKIAFAPAAANYDDANSARVVSFLKGKVAPGTTYEVWSFSPQSGSLSEAQRLGFYRAAMTRNLLIRSGIAPAQILTQVRVTDPAASDGHMVRVVIKP